MRVLQEPKHIIPIRHSENDQQGDFGIQWPHYEMKLARTLLLGLHIPLNNRGAMTAFGAL